MTKYSRLYPLRHATALVINQGNLSILGVASASARPENERLEELLHEAHQQLHLGSCASGGGKVFLFF